MTAANRPRRASGGPSRIAIASSIPSASSARGAMWNEPPKCRALATISIMCRAGSRRARGEPIAISTPG